MASFFLRFVWRACWLALGIFVALPSTSVAESGESVIVVYNSRMAESQAVAEYYAKRRNVPESQVIGMDLPTTETISRSEFQNDLQRPLFRWLEKQRLFVVRLDSVQGTNGVSSGMFWRVKESKIRYAVLCYGVPSRIEADPDIAEKIAESLPEPLRRNDAAVDSELSLLPVLNVKHPITGLAKNPFYNVENAADINPENGLLLVSRLDGPSPEIARGLVDKAMEAETNGLWGRAYFDLRGLTNGEYKLGDDLLEKSAEGLRLLGFETVVDRNPETFTGAFPLSHVAFYAGWYDEHVSGPFARRNVEFMPGAIAYHLHSFSASTIRTPTRNWVGPLLDKGATATFGYVNEPYLSFTMDVPLFFSKFIYAGFSFGEASYAAQGVLSWQTTIIGDPLYRPFAKKAPDLHSELAERKEKVIEWSHLRVVNLNAVKQTEPAELVQYLEEFGKGSAILMEKLGDLQLSMGKTWSAIHAYTQALDLDPSPQQEIRLTLTLGRHLESEKKDAEAMVMYRGLLKKFPDYPDRIALYGKLSSLATKLGKTADAEKFQAEVRRLGNK